MDQKEGESRLEYLTRVLKIYMNLHGDRTLTYDETLCDGHCLADDIEIEVSALSQEEKSEQAGVPEVIQCPRCEAYWAKDSQQGICIERHDECFACRFSPSGDDGLPNGTDEELEARSRTEIEFLCEGEQQAPVASAHPRAQAPKQVARQTQTADKSMIDPCEQNPGGGR